ncbi:hypothetical protein EV643_13820 [Kribbella sp. VKM Ac-2527]|uniref:Uncharacterized protein n=1 Tax=Kribbella caucasensis TaxID=2512215 RepID=A0A4R6J7N9_9ACTN|nr:hypothetical protein [Kribbella sp. VKM Ac-2527]TDO30406.1 hypothetical protein EV643_13820 [Kribbella sp. VKM Ac-2527]
MTRTSDVGSAITDFADTFGFTLMNQAQAKLSPQLRELHRAILTAFGDTGVAPTVAWIADRASLLGTDPDQALASLADADLVHTADGSVTVAYPRSPAARRRTESSSTTAPPPGRCAAPTPLASR